MTEMTTEMLLSIIIVILTVLAIIVFIVYGAGTTFYALFVVVAVIMFYTWNRISHLPDESRGAAKVSYIRKTKNTRTKKRLRRKRA